MRVLETLKLPWTTDNATFYAIDMPEGTKMTEWDRIYTSPIYHASED